MEKVELSLIDGKQNRRNKKISEPHGARARAGFRSVMLDSVGRELAILKFKFIRMFGNGSEGKEKFPGCVNATDKVR